MQNTQQFNITLPAEMAEAISRKVASGAYADASEVMRDGIHALLEREIAVDRWLRDEVVAGHAEYMAHPEQGVASQDLLACIQARRAASSSS